MALEMAVNVRKAPFVILIDHRRLHSLQIELEHQVTPSPHTMLGAKGAGESGFAGAQAAVLNAVNDAIRSLGARLDATPASAPNVLGAIAKADAA